MQPDKRGPAREGVNGFEDVAPLGWARALRTAQAMGLSQDKLALLEQAILNGPDAALGAKAVAPAVAERLGQIELRIRQLAEGGAPWAELEPVLWQLYHRQPTATTAAKVVELAFLYGAADELFDVLKTMASFCDGFFEKIQEDVRGFLVLKLWLGGLDAVIHPFILDRDIRKAPVERLLEFRLLIARKEQANAFMYFQEHEATITYAVREFGAQLSMDEGELVYQAGRLALQLDYDVMARKLLGRIGKGHPRHVDALQSLLEIRVDRDEQGLCVFGRKLQNETDWRRRVKLLYEFLAEARRVDGVRHKSRPALNDLLRDPLVWVPPIPDAWGAVARMLVDHAELEVLLPHLLQPFADAALRFQPAALEQAFWKPLTTIELRDKGREAYWRGLATFHLFMTGLEVFQHDLWAAHELFEVARSTSARPIPVSWEDIHRAGTTWVAKNPAVVEKRRLVMQRQLKVATSSQFLTGGDVMDYLQADPFPPFFVLDRLISIARMKNDETLELRLLQKKGSIAHFANRDLARLWQLSSVLNKHDYAWRLATVLHTRGALAEKVVHPWAISGENRNEYALVSVPHELAMLAFKGLKPEEQKLLQAILRVGPLVPELIALLDDEARVIKVDAPKPGTREHNIEATLAAMKWVKEPKKYYRFSHEAALLGKYAVPAFVQILPHNTWSYLVVYLGARLGLGSWNWSLSWLHQQVEGLMPKLPSARQSKVGRWLKSLDPEERTAWYDLAATANKISDERGVELMAMLLTRLAVMINQNHYQALTSLQTMRVPVAITWQLENWILSEDYSQARRKLQSNCKVPVPLALQKCETILKF